MEQKEKLIEERLKEKCDLVDVISYAMRGWEDYLDECYEEEIPPQDSLCPQCKFENENDYDKCSYCTMVVDVGYSFLLCGIPVGSGITHLHKNFESKEEGGEG